MTYSRRQPISTGEMPRITGLNSFGQPFRGRKIRGVGAEERAVGRAYSKELSRGTGPLSTRHQDGSQGNYAERKLAEAEVAAQATAERKAQEAAERGRAAAHEQSTPKISEIGQGRFAAAARRSADAAKKMNPSAEARKKITFGSPRTKEPFTSDLGSARSVRIQRIAQRIRDGFNR